MVHMDIVSRMGVVDQKEHPTTKKAKYNTNKETSAISCGCR
jgi:hypothetical protein